MKHLFTVLLLSSTLLANEVETFFKASKDNFVFCRAGYEIYVMLSSANSSIVSVNHTKYFKYKNEDRYLPLAGCKTVQEHDEGIVF